MAKTPIPDKSSGYRPRLSDGLKWRVIQAAGAAKQDANEYLENLIERYLPPQFQKNPRES